MKHKVKSNKTLFQPGISDMLQTSIDIKDNFLEKNQPLASDLK